MKKLLLLLSITTSLITAQAQTKDPTVGVLGEGGTWRFLNGTEFPGATGKLAFRLVAGQPVGVLTYDFTAGGRYVSAITKADIGADISELRFKIKSTRAERLAVRLRDSSGQYHQFALAYSSPGEWQTLRQPVAGVKSPTHFQGNNDGIIAFPVVEFLILVNSPSGEAKSGELMFSDVKVLR
jgi:hypothetical protein